ncbi:MAG TPA: HD domain-containing phosphohydrolase [Terriglobales bacterium]|nr:HD domain-containing phosphohydrolase [Terriglobales bacterium]
MSARVLVADDERENRELLSDMLDAEGHSVVTANDGRHCLEMFARERPDIVLLDVHMPAPDGFAVCRLIKSDPDTRLIPVVMVTGHAQSDDRMRGIDAGADDFLIKPIDRSQLLARVRSLLGLKFFTDELERTEAVLFALAQSIEGKDPYTAGHCDRLSTLSAMLGEAIGLPSEQLTALRRGGIVHDIGKVAVPDSILLKPGRLDADEMCTMRQHPVAGEEICRPLKSFRHVLPIIRHHHEKMNGSGYPDGLRGQQIPLTSRIMAIIDVFDALTTERPYKRALTTGEALSVMEEEVTKGWWDPELFETFRSTFHESRFTPTNLRSAWQRATYIG